MKGTKVLFAVSLVAGATTAGAAGCGSSKSPGTATSTSDASQQEDSGGDGATGGSGSHCSPLGGGMCNPGQGLTCCVDLLAAITNPTELGTCVAVSACTSNQQYECFGPTDCMTGQACCGGISIEAGLFPGFADAGDASFDAAAFLAAEDDSGGGGGISGLPNDLSGITVESFCQASCSASQTILCSTDSDCPSNLVCGSPLNALAGGEAGAGLAGLGGGLAGFGGGLSLMSCQPPVPDAGTIPIESGAPSGEAGAPPSEAGATSTDAGADASPLPSEASTPSDGAAGG